MAFQDYTNDYSSTLTAAYSSGGGTLTVSSSSGLPTSGRAFYLKVDNEYFLCTAYSGGSLTVTGAQGGSAASNHSIGAAITACWIIPATLDGIRADQSQQGVAASLPTTVSQKKGNLYFCTDGPTVLQYDGAAWDAFGPVFPLTPPVLSTFTNLSTGATVTDTGGAGVTITGANNSGFSCYRTGPGATPFNVTMLVSGAFYNENFPQYGLLGRDSSTGKHLDWCVQRNSELVLVANKINADGTYNSTYKSTNMREMYLGSQIWLRIRDDGTTRYFQISPDGQNFITIFSVGRTDFCTCDQFGFQAFGSSNAGPCARIYHFSQG